MISALHELRSRYWLGVQMEGGNGKLDMGSGTQERDSSQTFRSGMHRLWAGSETIDVNHISLEERG